MDTSTLMRMRVVLLFSRVIRVLFALSAETLLWTSHYIFFSTRERVSVNDKQAATSTHAFVAKMSFLFLSHIFFFHSLTALASHHIYHRNFRELICVLSRVYLLNKALPANSSHPIFVTTGQVFLFLYCAIII